MSNNVIILEKIVIKDYPYCDGCAGEGCEEMCYHKRNNDK